jgi:hypothetical protein
MQPADLERMVHRELRRLPSPMAPATLVPRVLAAVQQWSARPWYERAWFTWPIGWQVISLAALVGLFGAGVMVVPSAEQAIEAMVATRVAAVTGMFAILAERGGALVAAAQIVWRSLGAPLVPYAFVVVTLMCLACAAFGTALNRVVFERT